MSVKSNKSNTSHQLMSSCPSSTVSQSFHVTITVPRTKTQYMTRTLKTVFKTHMVLDEFIEILDKGSTLHPLGKGTSCVPQYTVTNGGVSSPSLSIMLFLPESGPTSAHHLRIQLEKLPWRHHHTIQLQNKSSSDTLGQQKFFFLSRHLPLWSVCPAHPDSNSFRVNIFTRRYYAMVEFYRLVTNTEMESCKPDFCLFPLYSSRPNGKEMHSQLQCEIALKRCPLVNPYPLTDAYLTFPIHNIQALKRILPCPIQHLSSGNYLACDPDGNAIILYDVTSVQNYFPNHVVSRLTKTLQPMSQHVDRDSIHSESVDSGRFSDFDTCSSELEQSLSLLTSSLDWSTHTAHEENSDCQPDCAITNNAITSNNLKTFFV